MYDDNQSPYRCPICLTRPSLCTRDALTNKVSVGCMTCDCSAPVFTQNKNESKYMPLILWDRWVVRYRYEHPDWHRKHVCQGCLNYVENKVCQCYNADVIHCSEAVYPDEEIL